VETINAASFKATCLALLDKVEKMGQPIRVTKRGNRLGSPSSVNTLLDIHIRLWAFLEKQRTKPSPTGER
jgi:hypothetical protein